MTQTRTCTEHIWDTFPTSIKEDIIAILKKYQWKIELKTTLMICEITTTTERRWLFGRKKEELKNFVFLTPTYLLWAIYSNGKFNSIIAGQLINIEYKDYEESEMYKLRPDTGLCISGRFIGLSNWSTYFMGLCKNNIGEKFRLKLKEAKEKTEKPYMTIHKF
jgi:hypothetical protein